jgi:rubrerythrin
MENFKSTEDIINYAIQSEQEAHDFYMELSELVKFNELKVILKQFAAEELGHKQKLSRIIVNTDQTGLTQESVLDMKMADYHVDIVPKKDMTYQDLLTIAMKKEKGAFKLYTDLANKISDQNIKEIFLGLAQEEAKHKLRFEIEYDEYILKDN